MAADVGRLLDHAHQPLIAGRAGAIDARIDVGDVVAHRTQPQAGFHVAHRGGQRLGVFIAGAQNVEGQPLRALRAHARQLLQLVNQPRHRLRKFRHRKN